MHLPLSEGSMRLQGPLSNAFLAAATALSISLADPCYTLARTDSSAGLITSNVFPLWALRN